jgi:site-specific recombinase XerC
MAPWIPQIDDVLTAVIILACRGGEQLRMPRVYSVLSDLKAREVLLSGLHFSITGAVCYSRQVEEILRSLVAKGMLVTKERDMLVVRDQAAEEVRTGLRKRLPSTTYRALQTASKRFYRVMFKRKARLQDPLTDGGRAPASPPSAGTGSSTR